MLYQIWVKTFHVQTRAFFCLKQANLAASAVNALHLIRFLNKLVLTIKSPYQLCTGAVALAMAMWVGGSTTLIQTEISCQQLDRYETLCRHSCSPDDVSERLDLIL